MPLQDFINRTKNGYCIVCKTCRDRQLKRYYGRTCEDKQGYHVEKKDSISRYPYDNDSNEAPGVTNKSMQDPVQKEGRFQINKTEVAQSADTPLSTTTEGTSFRNIVKLPGRTILPFLIPKCVAMDPNIRSSEIYMAKVLHHRSYLEKHYFPKIIHYHGN